MLWDKEGYYIVIMELIKEDITILNIYAPNVAEAEAPILWPPDAKSQLIRKDPDAEKGWRQKEKGAVEDEKVRWHHRLNGHEFEQTGVLQRMGSQRVRYDLAIKQQRYLYLIDGFSHHLLNFPSCQTLKLTIH